MAPLRVRNLAQGKTAAHRSMVVASMIGGYFGAHFAQKTKPEYVRAIVIGIGFTLSVYFFARQIWH